jgi:hypothetical protein
MITKILLNGPAAHILKQNSINANLPATCETIIQQIKMEKPELSSLRLRLSVNGIICPGNQPVQQTDQLILICPFAGG